MKAFYQPSNDSDHKKIFKIAENLREVEVEILEKSLLEKDFFEVEYESIEEVVPTNLSDWNLDLFSKTPHYLIHFAANLFKSNDFTKTCTINWGNFNRFISDVYFHYTYLDNPFHNFKHANNGKKLISGSLMSQLLTPSTG